MLCNNYSQQCHLHKHLALCIAPGLSKHKSPVCYDHGNQMFTWICQLSWLFKYYSEHLIVQLNYFPESHCILKLPSCNTIVHRCLQLACIIPHILLETIPPEDII